MSKGHFDYSQYQIKNIISEIEHIIQKNGKLKTEEELKEENMDSEWYKKYPNELYHYRYPVNIIEDFKQTVKIAEKAFLRIDNVDSLLSGDISDDTFLENTERIEASNNKVTRVEVIDENGRSYVNWKENNVVEMQYQDDGKTLKIFITQKQ